MNFLEGVIETDQKGPVINTNGVQISLEDYATNEQLSDGRRVILGVRPEHITVGEVTQKKGFRAIVDIEEPMGADNLLLVRFAGLNKLGVRIPGSRRYAPGSEVNLTFDMSLASLFDASTELRI